MNNLLQMRLTISKAVALNHGHVLPLVAQYLINREDEVIQWFYKEVDWFEAKLNSETNNTGIRMFKRYAVITTSGENIRSCFSYRY